MPVAKDDVIDEAKKSAKSCGLVIKVLEGGAGFSKIDCCGLEISENEKTGSPDASIDRYAGEKVKRGLIIDENKNYPGTCGLKVEVVEGGNGFKSITCCGNELTAEKDSI